MATTHADLTDKISGLEATVRVAHAELRQKASLESALRDRIVLLKDKVRDLVLGIAVFFEQGQKLKFELKAANAECSALKAKYDELNSASYQYAEAMEECMVRQQEVEQDLSEKCMKYTGILLSGAVSLDSNIFETLESTEATNVWSPSLRSTDFSESVVFDSVSDGSPGNEEQHASARTVESVESPVHALDSSPSAPTLQRQKLQYHNVEELASYLQDTAIVQKACNSVSLSEQQAQLLDSALDPENAPCPMVSSGWKLSKLQHFRPQNGAVIYPSESQASGSNEAASLYDEAQRATQSTPDDLIKRGDVIGNVQMVSTERAVRECVQPSKKATH